MTVNVGVALDPSFGMWNTRYVFNHFDIPHRLQQMLQGASYSYWIRYTWETITVHVLQLTIVFLSYMYM